MAPAAEPVVTVSSHETGFGELVITPPETTLGPGWDYIPVNYPNAVWTDGSPQSLNTEILGSDVVITATPVEYRWDFGDGNTIVSTFPGEAWPEHTIWSTYAHEGWYQMSLTVVYEGSFTVDGGPPQQIDGTVEISVEPKWIFARSLSTRLVGENEKSREEYVVPERSTATLGPRDDKARTKRLTRPMDSTRTATRR